MREAPRPPTSITEALEALLSMRVSGEVHINVDGAVARLQVVQGRVAWVVADAAGERLGTALQRRTGLSAKVLQQVYLSCVERKQNYAEALVDRGLASASDVRAALVEHNARQLAVVINRGDAATLTFSAIERSYQPSLTFTLEELTRTVTATESSKPVLYLVPNPGLDHQMKEVDVMSDIKEALAEIMKLDGAIAAAVVDWESGLTLGAVGGTSGFDIELAASGNTAVVKAKMAVMRALGLPGGIEDILITLQNQIHLIRPLTKSSSLFLYVAIDKTRGNLGMARHRIRQIEDTLTV